MSSFHNNKVANKYFLKRMENIFIDRGRYKVVETFEEYLNHRYKNNCYWYSAAAIMGMLENDYLVRGSISLSHDWMWCDGGYEHGWVEFTFQGKEYVFDSRCKGVVLKQEWYEEFKPQNIVRYTKQQVLNTVFISKKMTYLQDGGYQITEVYEQEDTNNLFNPFIKSKIYFEDGKIKCFVAFKEFSN